MAASSISRLVGCPSLGSYLSFCLLKELNGDAFTLSYGGVAKTGSIRDGIMSWIATAKACNG